jgi:ribose transport system ATP-binding protein
MNGAFSRLLFGRASVNPPPFLEVRNVCKSFPGVRALDAVSLHVHRTEVLALVGENGAGKSTLMKILAGIYRPDAGEIYLEGRHVQFTSVADALRSGIVLIHQELNLAENLSVTANLFLGRETVRGGSLGWLNRRAMNVAARALLDRVGLGVRSDQRVGDLPPGQRQLVEVARALGQNARLIIMDEPTSSLTQRETEQLFGVIHDLKGQGVAVVYISHRLVEVGRVADRVTVLRDGRNVGDLAKDKINHDAMVRLMVGRDLKQLYPRRHADKRGPIRLEARNVTYSGGPSKPASFVVCGGEIVSMAGLVGAGRTELAEALFGLRKLTGGEVLLDGRPLRVRHPKRAIAAGLLLAPEDRRLHGLVLSDSVLRNLSLPNLLSLSGPLGWVFGGRERRLARDMAARLNVKASGLWQVVGQLSGGNQQKVVLGKWLARMPKVLILDEPTRGVDVGARSEIYSLMDQLAAAGVALLMISSDLEEVLGMSDRVLVLHEGRIAGELSRDALSQEAVMRLATGGSLGSVGAMDPRPSDNIGPSSSSGGKT